MNAKCKFQVRQSLEANARKKSPEKIFIDAVVSKSFLALLWLAFKRRLKILSVKCFVQKYFYGHNSHRYRIAEAEVLPERLKNRFV